MNKYFREAAITAIIATIMMAIFIVLGFVPIPESPTYSKWIKAIVSLVIYGIGMFIFVLLFLKFKFGK